MELLITILSIYALFLGADDKIADMEERLAEYQAEIDEITPELNEMNAQVERQEQKVSETYNRYDVLKRQLDSLKLDDPKRDSIRFLMEQARSEWHLAEDQLEPMVSVRDALQATADTLLLELELLQKNLDALIKTVQPTEPKMFISISLSQACETLIGGNMTSDCPTYKTLIDMFDNTNPGVSGDFVEKNNDLRRDNNQMNKHWEYYEQKDYQTVVMVDPDLDYKIQAVNIEVQANDFRVSNIWADQSRQSSFVNGTIISYSGLSVDRDCKEINTSPDLERIATVISFAISGCTADLDIEPNIIKLNATEFDKNQSRHYKYQDWLDNVIAELQYDARAKEMIKELPSKVYPDWFNNNVDWVESEQISNLEFINAYEMLIKRGILY